MDANRLRLFDIRGPLRGHVQSDHGIDLASGAVYILYFTRHVGKMEDRAYIVVTQAQFSSGSD